MTAPTAEIPATLADVEEAKNTILKEVSDIVEARARLKDNDPSNDAAAMLEIIQSLGVIGATLMGMAAAAVFIAAKFGWV